MSATDIASLVAAVGALFTALAKRGAVRGRVRRLESRLRAEMKARRECLDRISALETEMVTLRKLLPGGEWYRRLGLDTP